MIEKILFLVLLTSNLIFFAIAVYNYLTAPRIKNSKKLFVESPLISVLIPARNEQNNIADCIGSVLNQSYSNLEIIILNDNSTDNTAKIVESISKSNGKVKLLKGKNLPENWLGKNWACHQLSQYAKGEIFLFIDADVRLNAHAVSSTLKLFKENQLNMLTVFPTQKISSIGSYLVVPMMNWLLLTFLPLRKVFTSKRKSLVAANGQFLMIDKLTYNSIGGHQSVKNKVVEDMELARLIKKRNYSMMTALGDNLIQCSMYNGFGDSVNGFSKNFYKGFNTNSITFLLILLFIVIVFLSPIVFSVHNLIFIVVVLIILVGRGLISSMSKQSIVVNITLHFMQMLILFYVGFKSVYQSYTKGSEWKGRKIN